jgi:hypothetical protein
VLLSQAGDVPNADGLIEGGGNDEILFRMELGTHSIVIMASHSANQGAVLPVPYPDGLVIRGGKNPGKLVVEEDGADIVEMAIEGKETSSSLIGPYFDLVIVASRDEEGLSLVEIDATDGTVVLFEAINQSSHSVIPKLNGGGVKRHEDPWSLRVKGNTLRSRRLGLELGQHSGGRLHFGGEVKPQLLALKGEQYRSQENPRKEGDQLACSQILKQAGQQVETEIETGDV